MLAFLLHADSGGRPILETRIAVKIKFRLTDPAIVYLWSVSRTLLGWGHES